MLLGCLILSVCMTTAQASVITHGSSGGVFLRGGSDAYDSATFRFANEYADTLTLGSFDANAMVHTHFSQPNYDWMTDVFDVNTNSWVNIASFRITSVLGHKFFNLYASPISFSGLTISGLRTYSSIPVWPAAHFVKNDLTYTFSGTNPGSSVPEPASFMLLGLGLAGMAYARKKKTA